MLEMLQPTRVSYNYSLLPTRHQVPQIGCCNHQEPSYNGWNPAKDYGDYNS
jgi:hypothetical protein